jgi:N-methylhydantoinase A/oxoprolinase/acetone carboxylase beta subunit
VTTRIGVDVGGTFTKAVAVDGAGVLVAQSLVPTTHEHEHGVVAGVLAAVSEVAGVVGAESVELVTHSTTQAVNALLEGDVGIVGVIGLAARHDLRKVAKRTALAKVELAPGKLLRTVQEVLDVTDGLDDDAARKAIERLLSAGAVTACVAEAFSPDDDRNERRVVELGSQVGFPICASSELTGLYGLELRAVTAALNASIFPIAIRTADIVEQGVAEVGIGCPVMVMRGDGGATDLAGFRRAPARTLYSGPAASVAGALRHARVANGVVVEVGGTSTNVAAIANGRPAQSYVRVASHATALRAIDVRVVGVAGGSMLRVRRRGVYGVGPRSAHIAGIPYSCFADPAALRDVRTVEVAPRPGDPADYLVVESPGGARFALTNTCAANLLGVVHPGDYAEGNPESARLAFAAAATTLKLAPEEIARRMLEASAGAVAQLVGDVMHDHAMVNATIVAVGGGAGGLGRYVADRLGLECVVPPDAEVISSVGDALSMVRAAREITIDDPTPADFDALGAEAEQEAVASGASPATLDVRIEYAADRRTLRAVATGAIGLATGALHGRPPLSREEIGNLLRSDPAELEPVGSYWLFRAGSRVRVLDRFGDPALDVEGEIVRPPTGPPAFDSVVDELRAAVRRRARQLGPAQIDPGVWVVSDTRLAELPSADPQLAAAALSAPGAVAIVGRG